MNPPVKNLFEATCVSSSREEILALFRADHVRLDRIVSHGQRSPDGFWYDQPEDEWVLLLQGSAVIRFADESLLALKAGDYLLIPRHLKHRVDETSPDAIWLAAHSPHIVQPD
jgi:cupin 2 domain-containing protein